MKGIMYIAGAFHTVQPSICGGGKEWIDNDPHYWSCPPTWGICRNNMRSKANVGDYIFFVLPKAAKHPQSIFAYLKVQEKITHAAAYARDNLKSKQMGNKNPNGNIIVNDLGQYNELDGGIHEHQFDKIKGDYVIGDVDDSAFLTATEIEEMSTDFLPMLQRVFKSEGTTPISIISRYGRELSPEQVSDVRAWVDAGRHSIATP